MPGEKESRVSSMVLPEELYETLKADAEKNGLKVSARARQILVLALREIKETGRLVFASNSISVPSNAVIDPTEEIQKKSIQPSYESNPNIQAQDNNNEEESVEEEVIKIPPRIKISGKFGEV